MPSIRSNLNDISNIYGLSSIKKRINTSFQEFRTAITKRYHHYNHPHHKKVPLKERKKSFDINFPAAKKSFVEIFSTIKLKHQRKKIKSDTSSSSSAEPEALLLSSTGVNTSQLTKMTIDSHFMDIREDYPDLDAEIRSILLSRAQDGATIGEIRDDYYRLTGEKFPITWNTTNYLLTIPHVFVRCNENGTQIFNIMPTQKNQHLHDMVVKQKPVAVKSSYHCNQINHNHHQQQQQPQQQQQKQSRSTNWYSTSSNNNFLANPFKYRNYNNDNFYANNNNFNNRPNWIGKYPQLDKNSSRSDSDAGFHENNCFFEDNYNYLLNRFNQRENFHNANQLNNLNLNSVPIPTTATPLNNVNCNEQEPAILPTYQQQNQPQQPSKLLRNPLLQSRPNSRASSSIVTKSSQYYDSLLTNEVDIGAHLLDFQLLGDDFFLYLARMELKCKFKQGEKVLQSGLCVSGQTISAATKRIRQMDLTNRRLIINIGSVDILQGRPLVHIEHDFRQLFIELKQRGNIPILTTLAPLANYAHVKEIKSNLERFNEFIKRQRNHAIVIDVWSCLVIGEKKQTLFDCYQDQPRQVTGSAEPYLFWNKIGRQRVLQLIEQHIEY